MWRWRLRARSRIVAWISPQGEYTRFSRRAKTRLHYRSWLASRRLWLERFLSTLPQNLTGVYFYKEPCVFERRKTDPGPGHRGVTALQPVRDFFSNQHLVIVDHRMLRMAARNGAVYGNCKNAPARSTRAISTRGIQAREVPCSPRSINATSVRRERSLASNCMALTTSVQHINESWPQVTQTQRKFNARFTAWPHPCRMLGTADAKESKIGTA